jgi:hypothetical protein
MFFMTHCQSHLFFLVCLLAAWFSDGLFQCALVDAVNCSCEIAGQSVYGLCISLLGSFDPCQCKTTGGTTSSRVACSFRYTQLWCHFRRVHVLHVTCLYGVGLLSLRED